MGGVVRVGLSALAGHDYGEDQPHHNDRQCHDGDATNVVEYQNKPGGESQKEARSDNFWHVIHVSSVSPTRRRSYHLSTPLLGLGSENSGQNIDESLESRTSSY